MLPRLIGTLGLIAAGVALGRWLAARDAAPAGTPAMPKVRDAGPENMEHPPRRWDQVDETEDESFPASDPPGRY